VPRLFGCKELGLRRLREPPDAAPQVDLPARARKNLVGGVGVRDNRGHRNASGLAGTLPCHTAVVLKLRKKRRPGLHKHRRRLFNVCDCDLDVLVLCESLGDQRIEHRILELIPPLGVGGRSCIPVFVPEGDRYFHRRSLVIRADHAAGEQRCENSQNESAHHEFTSDLGYVEGASGAASGGGIFSVFAAERSARRSNR